MICKHYLIMGRVQGVGYRYFARRTAQELGICGWVRNLSDGSVEALAQGDKSAMSSFEECLYKGPPYSRVTSVDSRERDIQDHLWNFQITV